MHSSIVNGEFARNFFIASSDGALYEFAAVFREWEFKEKRCKSKKMLRIEESFGEIFYRYITGNNLFWI